MRWKGITSFVLMDHHAPSVGSAVDALASLALGELKSVLFNRTGGTSYRGVAKQRKRRVLFSHTVIATTGSWTTGVGASVGISSPAFCISWMYASTASRRLRKASSLV